MKHITRLIGRVARAQNLANNSELLEAADDIKTRKDDLLAELALINALENALIATVSKRAVELYGEDWKPIESDYYKILRVKQGAVYTITGDVDSQFTKQTISVDSAKTTDYLKQHGYLPDGIEPNPNRTERVDIKVH